MNRVIGHFKGIFFLLGALLLFGCSPQKETAGSKSMQNLTAHYNVLYNAAEQFNEAQARVLDAVADDYSQTLTIYREPSPSKTANKALDSVAGRANAIIGLKAKSDYVDDAWMLVAKVNYYKSEFYNAAEFFDYVQRTYYDDKKLRQEALVWKARTSMQLNDMDAAAIALDSALKHPIGTDHEMADVYATEAQFNIRSGNEENAAEMLKKALKYGSSKQNENRWNFVLAQLEEKGGHPEQAYLLYSAVVKSNASFEMAFNANLNRMKLHGGDSTPDGRIAALKSLAKQYKNRDFQDQIWFRIADIYMEQGDRVQAVKAYDQALHKSTVNTNQKGLVYLKLADLNFGTADYARAKSYYDSTLTVLNPSFPGFENIRIKSANLDFLAGRLGEISRQDTLQMLAKLPEGELQPRIGALVREQVKKTTAGPGAVQQQPGPFTAAIDAPDRTNAGEGKFYFNNLVALGQGFTDFKRKWGNRKLEDNWRRGNKGGADIAALITNNQATNANATEAAGSGNAEELLTRQFLTDIPFTEAQLRGSDQKIISAYYDIAGFYKDDLRDNAEAVRSYQELLTRFPNTDLKPSVYYNLYRLYSGPDAAKAAEYRTLLLREFPESLYANVILDPDYAKKADKVALQLNSAYSDSYMAYTRRLYPQAARLAQQAETQYGPSALSPQFAYLSALSLGHTQKLGPFEVALTALVTAYPSDQVVTPLVNQQLQFIKENREMLEKRPVALLEHDPDAPIFASVERDPEPLPVKKSINPAPLVKAPGAAVSEKPVPAKVAVKIPEEKRPEATLPNGSVVAGNRTIQANPEPVKNAPLFELPEMADYYFVINVTDPRINLSPSRFGLGQFIRSNYGSAGIRHQTKDADQNQLIYVGRFSSLKDVKSYESRIRPVLKDIMKIPVEKYDTFVITGKELDKLNGKTGIDQYSDFYRHQ